MLWAAQFTGPRLGGLLWALATWMKWIPAVLWLDPRAADPAAGASSGWPSRSGSASLTLPLTIIQLQALFGFGARPVRLDYLVYLWAFVPVALPPAGPVRLPAAGDLAPLGRPAARAASSLRGPARARRAASRAPTARRPDSRSSPILAPPLVDRPEQQRADAQQDDADPRARRAGRARRPARRRGRSACRRSRRRARRPTRSRRSTAPCTGRTRPSG